MKVISLSFLCCLLTSCTSFIKIFDNEVQQYEKISSQKDGKYCPLKQSKHSSIVTNGPKPSLEFKKIISSIKNTYTLDLIDEAVLLTLFQMHMRPIATTPESRLQIIYKKNNQISYYDYVPTNKKSLINGIIDFLKTNKKKRTIKFYVKLIDNYVGKDIPIDYGLAQNLKAVDAVIKNTKDLSKRFSRAGLLLKENEQFEKKRFYQNFKKFKEQRPTSLRRLFTYRKSNTQSIRCNIDLNLYSQSIYLINNSKQPFINSYGVHKDNDFVMMVSSTQSITNEPGELHYFKGVASQRSVPFCFVENKKNQIALFSLRGIDPGQHLFHLFENSIDRVSSLGEINTYLKFPRHQFLIDPLRVIYESERGNKKQLEQFHGLNIPLYHSDQIGEVWAWAKFENASSFIVDDRGKGNVSCDY